MLITFFDFRGIVHREWALQCQTVNQYFYLKVMKNYVKILEKKPESWKRRSWILHHDNAPVLSSLLVHQFLAKNQTILVSQPPYSPGLVPCDIFLYFLVKNNAIISNFVAMYPNVTGES